ncbi:MAG: Gfo/Idh/MocA family oxidoreductase [Candidatus Marinimicrobia bacterium]|nr:Gfo/Idh/MocA family oxidoreductase [Candidatus Neomarinimicrobiota bacterium]
MKAGIAGVGRFGSRHLDKWMHFDDAQVVGFYDTDLRVQERIQAEWNIPYLPLEDLLERIDVLDIVTPGSSHYDIARAALQAGKHVFIEKPFTEFEDQARELAGLAEAKQTLIGVGHIEHFNPVFRALREQMHEVPKTLEAYRQGPFLAGVGVDISIILELMIHDIELATRLIPTL